MLRELPSVAIEGHVASGLGSEAHPMRAVTRDAAAGRWSSTSRTQVERVFDDLAATWHERVSPERTAVLLDALERGRPSDGWSGPVLEVGSGTGPYSGVLASAVGPTIACDLSREMLVRAPASPPRVQADASVLPFGDGAFGAVVLINAFLFPTEVDRVLAPTGTVVWVNSSAESTPIHLMPDEVGDALPRAWTGVWARAGAGLWAVLRRSS